MPLVAATAMSRPAKRPPRPRFAITLSELDAEGRWVAKETLLNAPRFENEAEAVAHAEGLNARRWKGFDWLAGPRVAFLATRT